MEQETPRVREATRWLALPLLFTLLLVTPKIRSGDEIQYFSYLHSIVFDHDLEFGNEYAFFYQRNPASLDGFKHTFLERLEPDTGRHINFAPVGAAVLWSPAYLLAHVGVLVARALGSHVPADGLSRPYEAAVCYASALYGILGLLLVHSMLSRFLSLREPVPSLATLAVLLGTPLLYYMTLAPAFAHAVGFFVVTLLLFVFLASPEDWSLPRCVLLGALSGLAALVREQVGLFVAVPALFLVTRALRTGEVARGAVRLLVLAASAAVVFAPQLLIYHAVNGHYSPSHLVTRKMSYASPHALGILFDPGHGLFVWTPLLLLAALGLLLPESRKGRGLLVGFSFLLQVWVNGSIESWTLAGAFGSRRFVDSTAVFAWGLAAFLAMVIARAGKRTALATLLVCVWWNLSLMVQFSLKLMDRQQMDWPRVAWNQVFEVPPRLGRVVVLFFTDRERLLKEAP